MMLGENILKAIDNAIDGGESVFSIDSKAVKVVAFTVFQYFNLLNHIPIGQVKYAFFIYPTGLINFFTTISVFLFQE